MSERMSAEEYRKLMKLDAPPQKRSKYNNKKTEVDGIVFDSKAEAKRFQELKLLQEAGEIQGFGRQPSFIVRPSIRYIPDFIVCGRDGEIWVEDVKGVETDTFKLKQTMWEDSFPWLELRLIKY